MKKRISLYCNFCDYECFKTYDYNRHLSTQKHAKMARMEHENPRFRVCEACNYSCDNNTSWNKHIATAKHVSNINITNTINDTSGNNIKYKYKCKKCNEDFDNYKKYWRHQKKCDGYENITSLNQISPDLLKDIITENKELRSFLLNQAKDLQKQNMELQQKLIDSTNTVVMNNNTIHGNVNHQTNNKFNINVFLNENCKNAMNLSEFIDSIEVSREDLENNAQLGFVKGITKIIMDNLSNIDVDNRPFHCGDSKRHTMYVRNENKWQKDENNEKISGMIQQVSTKSMRTLNNWEENNSEVEMDDDFSNKKLMIMKSSIAGIEKPKLYPKVIHELAKETVIEK